MLAQPQTERRSESSKAQLSFPNKESGTVELNSWAASLGKEEASAHGWTMLSLNRGQTGQRNVAPNRLNTLKAGAVATAMITTTLLSLVLNIFLFLIAASVSAGEPPSSQSSLDVARQLLSDVERSPSANLDELRAKLLRARSIIDAAMKAKSDDPDALELSRRSESLLQSLAPKPHAEQPWLAEAEVVTHRLTTEVKGGGSCAEINALSTNLLTLVRKLELSHPQAALRFRERTRHLKTIAPNPSCMASPDP